MAKNSRVSARVPEKLVRELENIIEREGYGSMSICLRDCIEEFIKLKTSYHSTEKLLVTLGKDVLSDIDNLVDIGRVSDREEAFKHAVKDWAEMQMDKYLLQREMLMKKIDDNKSKLLESRARMEDELQHKTP
jgi:Arc/MetJ-type ribon-helix-helix transcriptional regulator